MRFTEPPERTANTERASLRGQQPDRPRDRDRLASRREQTHVYGESARVGLSLLILRLFLGVTFVYAGFQKLNDPGFLHPGAPTYIGTQLRGFANGTPGGFILRIFALPDPILAGLTVATAEIIIGLLVTVGLATRPAAGAGLGLNLLLFLTNSWHTTPYFLGSDIVFVFAWLPFVIVGAAQQPAVEAVLRRYIADRVRETRSARSRPNGPHSRPLSPMQLQADDQTLTRRSLLRIGGGFTGAGAALVAIFALLTRGSYNPPRLLGATGTPHKPAATARQRPTMAPHKPSAASPASPPAATVPAGAVKLGPANALAPGQATLYKDPSSGGPDILIRENSGTLVAYSAICTHAGCTVGYADGQIACPCHGSIFNVRTGAPINGPATVPLPRRAVLQKDGQVYALPA